MSTFIINRKDRVHSVGNNVYDQVLVMKDSLVGEGDGIKILFVNSAISDEELKENIEFFYRNYDDMSYVDKEFNINISLGTNAYLAEKKLNAILKAIEKINKKYGKGGNKMKNQLIQETAAGLAMATAFTDGDFKGMSIILNTEGGQAEVRLDVTSDGEARVFVYKVGEDEPSDTIVLN